MAQFKQYSEWTDKEIQRVLERARQDPTFAIGEYPADAVHGDKQVRWAKTTTDAANPTYPTAPAAKFVVEYGDYAFDNTTTGDETAVFTADTPQTTRIAYAKSFVAEDTVVQILLSHGRWFIQTESSSSVTIQFRITDIYRGGGLGCNAVEADILEVSCDCTSYAVDDVVIVWDSLMCRFNCPMDLLIGVRGYATLMTTPAEGSELALEQFDGGPQPTYPCRFVCTVLCCVEDG